VPDASTTVVDLCLQITNGTKQFLLDHNIPFTDTAAQGRLSTNLRFNCALEPSNKSTDIVAILPDEAFPFYSNATDEADIHEALFYAMATSGTFMDQHRWMGCDVTVIFDYQGERDSSDDCCNGGLANTLDSTSNSSMDWQRMKLLPLGVVDIYCMLNNREEVLSHELGHVFVAQHDLATCRTDLKRTGRTPARGDCYGHGECNDDNSDCWHTIMSYPIGANKRQRSIGYFSCADQVVAGRRIGFEASNSTDGYGADNCSIIRI
jgi:hypothetical protein